MATLYDRTTMLIGMNGLEQLKTAHIAIVGIGGVGSYVAEALARAGVGTLTLVDHDCIDITNLNRQLHAMTSTVGRPKVDVMAERIRGFNTDIHVITKQDFLLDENIGTILNDNYDYIVDAIDTVTAKVNLVLYAKNKEIPIICSMGTANKLDNTKFEFTDISKTHTCPLARVMRKALKDKGITENVKVLYSTAPPMKLNKDLNPEKQHVKPTPASISFVPGTAGLLIAGEIVRYLLQKS